VVPSDGGVAAIVGLVIGKIIPSSRVAVKITNIRLFIALSDKVIEHETAALAGEGIQTSTKTEG
jgi:hypothetical protein|tara:strand:- start:1059 stop:1250 length:192 start_codon:yes stop_codon:yes gene_type:complete